MIETSAVALLHCRTPDVWVEAALINRETLLIDHATCERKAAAAALGLIHRYVERADLRMALSRLAREELRHFEQVLVQMKRERIEYRALSAGRYANGLRTFVRTEEPGRLLDLLLVAGVIEARSCERFGRIRDADSGEFGRFYGRFCASEARHFGVYFELAARIGRVDERTAQLLEVERKLIETKDPQFRFHSGVPAGDAVVNVPQRQTVRA